MRAGWLRHRITIQRKSVTRNDYGEEVETWADLKNVWASIEPLRGQEFIESKALQETVDHRIRMRYNSDLTSADRIKWGSRYFEIEAVLHPFERKRETVAMCREEV